MILAPSGGQARRLTIVRALLKAARILVVDEPTEGLDSPTAINLIKTLNRSRAGRSILLMTDRSEGLERMNEILLLDRGRITAQGDHGQRLDELLSYRQLWGMLDQYPCETTSP